MRAARTAVALVKGKDAWRCDWHDHQQQKKYALQREERARDLMPQKLLPESALESDEALAAALKAEDKATVATMAALIAESNDVAGRITALKAELAAADKAQSEIECAREAAQRAWFKAVNANDNAAKEAAYTDRDRATIRQKANEARQGILRTKIDELSRTYADLEAQLSSARAAQARLQASAS